MWIWPNQSEAEMFGQKNWEGHNEDSSDNNCMFCLTQHCIVMNNDFDRYVLNNHLVQYVEGDELEANDIRQAIVDYLY